MELILQSRGQLSSGKKGERLFEICIGIKLKVYQEEKQTNNEMKGWNVIKKRYAFYPDLIDNL